MEGMKTNQIMLRKMGAFDVEQRTKDGYFNATSLLRAWNKENPTLKRELDNFWKSTHLTELMSEIAKKEMNFKSVDFTDLKSALSQTVRGKQGGTWMHPILFIKFAMYLNPAFEYQVIKFVADKMIAYRKDAGDAYRALSSAVSKMCNGNDISSKMSLISKGLNYIVFNCHSKEQRNKHGTEKEMKELFYLERHLADLVNDGMIKDYPTLLNYMRNKWDEKWCPKLLR